MRESPVSTLPIPGSTAAGGLLNPRTETSVSFMCTVVLGVPVTVNNLITEVDEFVLAMYNVWVGLRDWTGWTENRVAFGPRETKCGVMPVTRSLFSRIQYSAPSRTLFEQELKTLTDTANWSLLTPITGW